MDALFQNGYNNCVDRLPLEKLYTVNSQQSLSFQSYPLTNIQESGWISCLADNEFGTDMKSGYITVVDEWPIDPVTAERMTMVRASVGIGIPVLVVVGVLIVITAFFRRRAKVTSKRGILEWLLCDSCP